ncbi:MAG TPA: hypothetical protein VJR70_05510 [Stellaceae bacterium]|nr:hypothetical protein [Stellaceae bacterium]
MMTFHVKAEPLASEGPIAIAIVVAEDEEQALLLLRKDINFSGYRMPPAELRQLETSNEQLRQALGGAVAQEIGVYGFTTLGPAEADEIGAPPAAVS